MKFEPFTCNQHNQLVEDERGCLACLAEWENLSDPADMAPEDRMDEFDRLCGQLTIPVDMVHRRIEALVGRPVFLHEIPLAYEQLRTECLWQERDRPVDVDAAVQLLEDAGKHVIVVEED